MNLDDKSLFLDAMEDVQPLKRNNDVHWHPGRNSRAPQRVDTLQLDNFLTTGYLDICLLYTSDAADDLLCVDLGGRRILQKKNPNKR